MANEEQLAILKQGVDVWNRWRTNNPIVDIDLSEAYLFEANLYRANLSDANLSNANLFRANLHEADLFRADFTGANLGGAYFREATLINAYLYRAYLHRAYLRRTDLRGADFRESDLRETDLRGANLSKAYLTATNLTEAKLKDAGFAEGIFDHTILASLDLSATTGLESAKHLGPSPVSTDTLQKSQGNIPEEFLRGCGLSDWEIESAKLYWPDLSNEEISKITQNIFDLKATQAIQISRLFISYSHANSAFVDKLETKLNEKGIRFWRDIHDATAGRLERQIHRAIRHNPTVLLILSEHSTNSDWVEHEARLARKFEKELGRDVLCPIGLDDSWKTCNWPERIKEQIMEYNILDFANWEDDAALDEMFKKLIDGLDMFYKKEK